MATEYKKVYLPDFPPILGCQDTGPDVGDGSDAQGFPGGDQRHNLRPTTIESALVYLAEFLDDQDRRFRMDEIYSML